MDFIVANTNGGVYMTTESSIEYLNTAGDNQQIMPLDNAPLWFDTTNPSSQPLPESMSVHCQLSTL